MPKDLWIKKKTDQQKYSASQPAQAQKPIQERGNDKDKGKTQVGASTTTIFLLPRTQPVGYLKRTSGGIGDAASKRVKIVGVNQSKKPVTLVPKSP